MSLQGSFIHCQTCGYAWRSALPSGQIPVKCASCKNPNARLQRVSREEYERLKKAPELIHPEPARPKVGSGAIRNLSTLTKPSDVLQQPQGKAAEPTPPTAPPATPAAELSPTARALQARINELDAQRNPPPPSSIAAAAGEMVGKLPDAVDLLRATQKDAAGQEKDAIDKLNEFMEKNQGVINIFLQTIQGGVEAAQRNAEAKSAAMLRAVELQHERDLEKLRLEFELRREIEAQRQPAQIATQQGPQWVPLSALSLDERMRYMNSPALRKSIVNGMVPLGSGPMPAAPPSYPAQPPQPTPAPREAASGPDAMQARIRAWEDAKRANPHAPAILAPPIPLQPVVDQHPESEPAGDPSASPARNTSTAEPAAKPAVGVPAPPNSEPAGPPQTAGEALLPTTDQLLDEYERHLTQPEPDAPTHNAAPPATRRKPRPKPIRLPNGTYRCPIPLCDYKSHKQGHVRNHIPLAHRDTKETPPTMPAAPQPTPSSQVDELAKVAATLRTIPVETLDELRAKNANLLDQPVSILQPMLPAKLTGGAMWGFMRHAPIRSALGYVNDETRHLINNIDLAGLRALVAEADPSFLPIFDRNADWLGVQFDQLKTAIGA